MALPNTNISVAMVKTELGAATNDVGQLCIHPNVNEWSPYKPISSGAITLNEAFREEVSGFLIIGRYLSYNKPTGGAGSPYRLDDFRGYEHNSRKPQNTSITSNVMALNEDDTHGPSNASISISVTLPDTNTFKKIMSEYQVTPVSYTHLIRPVAAALEQLKKPDPTAKTKIPEIDDLIEFLAAQDESSSPGEEKQLLTQEHSALFQEFVKNIEKLSAAEKAVFDLYVQGLSLIHI